MHARTASRRRDGCQGECSFLTDESVWQAGRQGRWSTELLEAALSRSDSIQGLTAVDGRPQSLTESDELRRLVRHPSAYFIDYADGTRATLLMLDGAVADYTFAARLRGSNRLESTQFLLPPNPNVAYSACLMHKVEEMLETGQAPYPVERTLLVSGMLESCLESKIQGSKPIETPHLDVRYHSAQKSQYCQT